MGSHTAQTPQAPEPSRRNAPTKARTIDELPLPHRQLIRLLESPDIFGALIDRLTHEVRDAGVTPEARGLVEALKLWGVVHGHYTNLDGFDNEALTAAVDQDRLGPGSAPAGAVGRDASQKTKE